MRSLLWLEIKIVLKSPSSILIFLIPLGMLVGLGWLMPASLIVPSSITIGIVGAIIFYFGGGLEEMRRTSFIKSVGMTKLNKATFFIIKILVAIFVALLSILFTLMCGWILTDIIPFLATDFSNLMGEDNPINDIIDGSIDWTQMDWWTFLYASVITAVIALTLALVIVSFVKTTLAFYLFGIGYIVAMILFGGVIMPQFLTVTSNNWIEYFYYFIPNFYTNNMLSASFNQTEYMRGIKEIFDLITPFLGNVEESLDGIIVQDPYFLEKIQIFVEAGNAVAADPTLIFSDYINNAYMEAFGYDFSSSVEGPLISILYLFGGIMEKSEGLPEDLEKHWETYNSILNLTDMIITAGVNDNLTNTIEILDSWLKFNEPWNMDEVSSVLDVFVPIGLSASLLTISSFKFKWSI